MNNKVGAFYVAVCNVMSETLAYVFVHPKVKNMLSTVMSSGERKP